MSAFKGDYLGFSIGEYNNDEIIFHHSSEFGIAAVSTNNRYSDKLTSDMENKSVRVPNGDGYYYFGSTYTQRLFSINFAFDNMSEMQKTSLKSLLNKDKKLCLIFDEEPYKVWNVTLNAAPYLKFIAFDTNRTISNNYHATDLLPNDGTNYPSIPKGRIYKGEGEVSFVAFYPFAKERYKFINDYIVQNIPEWKYDESDVTGVYNNIEEWQEASGIINYMQKDINDSSIRIDLYDAIDNTFYVYNAGDIDSPLKIFYNTSDITYAENDEPFNIVVKLMKDSSILKTFTFSSIKASEVSFEAPYICVNANTGLIEGYMDYNTPSGQTFNHYIVSGMPFKLPPMREKLDPTDNNQYIMHYQLNSTTEWDKVEYHYWYR